MSHRVAAMWMVAESGLKVGRRFADIAWPPMREIHAITPRNAPIPQPLVEVMVDICMEEGGDGTGTIQQHACHPTQQMGAKSLPPHRRCRCQ
ncbi:hypothetical protein D3C85_1559560 [compost metagenome]